MGTMVRHQPMYTSARYATHLTHDTSKIIMASLDNKTRSAYLKVWHRFTDYCHVNSLNVSLPILVILLLNFLTSLFQLGYKPSTIASHVSAIAFKHKIQEFSDPTSSFLVRQFLKGAKKLKGAAFDMRLPITTNIMQNMILAVPKAVMLCSQRSLLTAIFLLSFNAFLRMGEICLKHGYSPSLVIQRKDLSFIYQAGLFVGMRIVIRNYKNNLKQLPMMLILPMNHGSEICCPVRAVQAYLAEYTHNSGPLFQFQNGSPSHMHLCLRKCALSFRFLGWIKIDINPILFK